MCNIFVHRGGGLLHFQYSRGGFDKGRGNSGGLRPPSELCFGTSGIECYASWSYMIYNVHIPDLNIKLLISVIQ